MQIIYRLLKMKDMKKIIIAVLLGWFAITVQAQNIQFYKSNFPENPKGFKDAKANLGQGNKYFEMGPGMYMTALEFFLKAQAFNPNNADLNYKIGKCYLASIQKTKAVDYLEKALSLDPYVGADGKRTSDVKYLLAEAYHSKLDFDKAIQNYNEYKVTLSPEGIAGIGEEIDRSIQECEVGKVLVKKPASVFIDNLGQTVNSIYPEYSPLITADESSLFFTSRRNNTTGEKRDPNDLQYYEDIYTSEKVNGMWTTPRNPPKPLNGKKHDATVGLSPDGQTLLVYKGSNGGDIYESKLKGDKWTKPSKLPKTINTPFHESSASFSPDMRLLYFVSDRPEGGYGGKDIWVSKKNKKGKWDVPTNLGPAINTKYDEEGVFMHTNGKTLYFSSQGHSTMGGYDIFKSTITSGVWSTPENIGYPINSADDDVFFSISASGIHGYYSSVKAEGLGGQDLYMITFFEEKPVVNNTEDNLLASIAAPVKETVIESQVEIKENSLTLLKGIVQDEITLNPLGAILEITDNDKNELIASFESNSKTGKYLITLPSGKNYGLAVKAEGYLFHSENFNIPPTTSYREVEKNILMKKVEVGSNIVLNNIFFDYNKSTLRQESYAELERLLKLLTDMPSLKIEISGHTDNRGAAAYNKKLSEDRAKAVVDYLISKGIKSERLTFAGFGFDKPLVDNDTDEHRQMNRRTEFKVTGK
jgi:outer membrane protein OmpA-like peptidoglycan-associated protein/tetratricopeptide (TPR) repeat protein